MKECAALQVWVKPMNRYFASCIATWSYQGEYSFYSMIYSEELISELLSGPYVAAVNEQDELVGFYCYGFPAQVRGGIIAGIYDNDAAIDFGLGLRPDLTGQGMGASFVEAGVAYALNRYAGNMVRLVVATFNRRAIRAYERAGFTKGTVFECDFQEQRVEFMVMHRLLTEDDV